VEGGVRVRKQLGFLCLSFNGGFGLDGGRLVPFRSSSGILCFVSDPNIEIHNASIVSDPVMLIGSYRSFPCVAPLSAPLLIETLARVSGPASG
jgi:hypothetical protein